MLIHVTVVGTLLIIFTCKYLGFEIADKLKSNISSKVQLDAKPVWFSCHYLTRQ